MKRLKQLFCMLLVAAMVAGMLPTTAFASGSAYRPGAGGNGNTPGMTLEQFAAQTALLQKNYPAGEKNEWAADPMGQDGTDEEDDLAGFATGRVIVKSYEKITDKEAVAVAGPYKGIYVFQYADAAAAFGITALWL